LLIGHRKRKDKEGRYGFMVPQGRYKLDVVKQGFTFPTQLLLNVKEDGRLLDLYHGEEIEVTEEGVMFTPNVPLDPVGETKTPRRIIWEKRSRVFQHVVSITGIGLTLGSLYVTPTWTIAGFLVVHVTIYALFTRYVKPKRPKGWGVVFDGKTKKPIGKVIARLFTRQYNKLVSSEVTDGKGRYSFLVGPNDYYVTYEKPGYDPEKVENVVVEEGDAGVVKEDIGLKKK
jgi:hypothetical protein